MKEIENEVEETMPNVVPTEASDTFLGDTETDTKRRAFRGTLVVGGLILAAVGGLALMHLRTGPATANASDATKAVNTFLGDGKKNLATMQRALSDTDKLVEDFKNYPAAAQVPLEDLSRNPFSEGKAETKSTDPVENFDRQARLNAAMKQVEGLKVQSIMYSDTNRSCMINGRFRTEGDEFDGFKVERISPASVIVQTGGFRFDVKVKN